MTTAEGSSRSTATTWGFPRRCTSTPSGAFVQVAEVVLDAFGASRVMFGSDWPVCLLRGSYASVTALARTLTTGLSAEERAAVFRGTAEQVYGLGVS